MEKLPEVAWVDMQVGRVGVSGSHQDRLSGAKLVEAKIWHVPSHAGWVRKGLHKG